MSTLLLPCCFPILGVVASYEKSSPNTAALEWEPVACLAIYVGAALLLVVATCAVRRNRRERLDSKTPLGTDLVERGVLYGERPAGPCDWLSQRWPWSPAPVRSPPLGRMRAGLAHSTHPLLRYQLLEKRHLHRVRAALSVLRTDLKELQEQAEKEDKTLGLRESRVSGDAARKMSADTERGSASDDPGVWLGAVSIIPVESTAHRISWSKSTDAVTSSNNFPGESQVETTQPLDHVVITGDSTQSDEQMNPTEFDLDIKSINQDGLVTETPSLKNFSATGAKDSSQPVTLMEAITHSSEPVTPFEDVVKAKSYAGFSREVPRDPDPTVSTKGILSKRDLPPLRQEQNSIDLEQSSDSDVVLVEISNSSDDFPTFQPSFEQSAKLAAFPKEDVVSERPSKTVGYSSTETGDPAFPPSPKEAPAVTLDAMTQHPDVYISVLDEMSEIMLYKKNAKQTKKQNEVKASSSDINDANKCVSSCFLHDIVPLSQQDQAQSDKHNSSKSVQNTSLHPEKLKSVQPSQHRRPTQYKVAPASVKITNSPFFSSPDIATERQNVKSSRKNVADEPAPELKTSWDLLHSFPCSTNVTQTSKIETMSQPYPVSRTHSGIRQRDELSVHLSCLGEDVQARKQREGCYMKDITSDSRQKYLSAGSRTSAAAHQTGSSLVSDFEPATEQHLTPNNQGVLHWRITICPHPANGGSGHTSTPDQGPSEH